MNLICPRCNMEMKKIYVSNIELDLCQSCEGVWFDKNEIEEVLSMDEEELAASELSPSLQTEIAREEIPGKGGLKCPRCENELYRYNYAISSGILIDGCEKGCGLWVDDGEIKKIFEYYLKSQQKLDPEKEKLLIEQLKIIEREAKEREEKFIDSLVRMDNRSGFMKYPGKVLQFIYKCFYKMGL